MRSIESSSEPAAPAAMRLDNIMLARKDATTERFLVSERLPERRTALAQGSSRRPEAGNARHRPGDDPGAALHWLQ